MNPHHRKSTSGDAGEAGFVREIEALSKALSLESRRRPPRSLSAGRSRAFSPTAEPPSLSGSRKKPKKPPSFWNWKPLKALSQLRLPYHHHQQRRFDLLFSLCVHSIDALPNALSNAAFRVHFDDAQTRSVIPFLGVAEFEETLSHRRSVLATWTGPHQPAKYEPCQFVVCVSIKADHGTSVGKHRVDLVRLLPVTLEELEGETRSGMWSTSFRLAGPSKGGSLTVSFGFEVIENGGDTKASEILGLKESRLDSTLRRVGSIPGCEINVSCDRLLLQSVIHGKSMLHDGSDKSSASDVDLKPVHSVIAQKEDLSNMAERGEDSECCDEPEFVVIEKGIEITASDRIDELQLENRELEKAFDQQGHDCVEEDFLSCHKDCQKGELLHGDSVVAEELKLSDLEAEASYKRNAVLGELSYRTGRMRSRSYSLDDLMDSVAGEFLSMLELEQNVWMATSDGNIEAPREQLWEQFEESMSETDNEIFGLDSRAGKEIAANVDLSLLVHVAELEYRKATQAMESKSRARMLDEAEIGALMREWGLNEKALLSSPPERRSGGFGSPIDLAHEELL